MRLPERAAVLLEAEPVGAGEGDRARLSHNSVPVARPLVFAGAESADAGLDGVRDERGQTG